VGSEKPIKVNERDEQDESHPLLRNKLNCVDYSYTDYTRRI